MVPAPRRYPQLTQRAAISDGEGSPTRGIVPKEKRERKSVDYKDTFDDQMDEDEDEGSIRVKNGSRNGVADGDDEDEEDDEEEEEELEEGEYAAPGSRKRMAG